MKLRRNKNQFSGMENVKNARKEETSRQVFYKALCDAYIFSNTYNW